MTEIKIILRNKLHSKEKKNEIDSGKQREKSFCVTVQQTDILTNTYRVDLLPK